MKKLMLYIKLGFLANQSIVVAQDSARTSLISANGKSTKIPCAQMALSAKLYN